VRGVDGRDNNRCVGKAAAEIEHWLSMLQVRNARLHGSTAPSDARGLLLSGIIVVLHCPYT